MSDQPKPVEKIRTFKVGVSLPLQGCRIEDTLEFSADIDDAEIEAEVREWALEYVEWWHEEVKSNA